MELTKWKFTAQSWRWRTRCRVKIFSFNTLKIFLKDKFVVLCSILSSLFFFIFKRTSWMIRMKFEAFRAAESFYHHTRLLLVWVKKEYKTLWREKQGFSSGWSPLEVFQAPMEFLFLSDSFFCFDFLNFYKKKFRVIFGICVKSTK